MLTKKRLEERVLTRSIYGRIKRLVQYSVVSAFVEEVGEHLKRMVRKYLETKQDGAHLDGIERPACALGMELDPPDLATGFRGRLDAFYGRVVAVDEERLPSGWEGILQLEGVLMILARRGA